MERWIDLTITLDEETPVYPGDIPIKITEAKTIAKDGYNLKRITTGMHIGTHLDSKMHMLKSNKGIDMIDPNLLIGKAQIIRPSISNNIISMKDVVNQYDKKSKIVIYDLNWAMYFGDNKYYHYPKFERSIFDFLLKNEIHLIGLDYPSPEYHDETGYEMHKDLLGNDIYIIENLCNLKQLQGTIDFIALPMKLRGFDGSFIRCVGRNSHSY